MLRFQFYRDLMAGISSRSGIAIAVIFAWSLSSLCSAAPAKITNVRFSEAEIKLLQRLDQIQKGAGISATMLKATPFVQLFGSPAPMDVAITIGTNDWDMIFASLKALKKIQSCQVVKELDLWTDADGNSYSNDGSRLFFTELRSKANEAC